MGKRISPITVIVSDTDPTFSSALIEAVKSADPLTRREIEVLELVTEGMRNKETASRLDISEDTVAVHLRNTFVKLKVNERTTAVTVALRRGIVHLPLRQNQVL